MAVVAFPIFRGTVLGAGIWDFLMMGQMEVTSRWDRHRGVDRILPCRIGEKLTAGAFVISLRPGGFALGFHFRMGGQDRVMMGFDRFGRVDEVLRFRVGEELMAIIAFPILLGSIHRMGWVDLLMMGEMDVAGRGDFDGGVDRILTCFVGEELAAGAFVIGLGPGSFALGIDFWMRGEGLIMAKGMQNGDAFDIGQALSIGEITMADIAFIIFANPFLSMGGRDFFMMDQMMAFLPFMDVATAAFMVMLAVGDLPFLGIIMA